MRRRRDLPFLCFGALCGVGLAYDCSRARAPAAPTASATAPAPAARTKAGRARAQSLELDRLRRLGADGIEDDHTTSTTATTGGHTGCSQCGPTELCDPSHIGIDDNCDGNVDEGCPCTPGDQHSCFKGDDQYINTPGCRLASRSAARSARGACVGGFPPCCSDNCQNSDMTLCHAITDLPFADIDLKTGTGNFSLNADAGSETWTVACPAGVSPCPTPGPTPPSIYEPIQSGTYTVTVRASATARRGAPPCHSSSARRGSPSASRGNARWAKELRRSRPPPFTSRRTKCHGRSAARRRWTADTATARRGRSPRPARRARTGSR